MGQTLPEDVRARNMQDRVSAIIVAAGRGVRFGAPDKTFSLLAGRPMVCWSLDAFSRADSIAEIVLVAATHTQNAANALLTSGQWPKLSKVVLGGERRQDSVRIGTQAASSTSGLVAIHDAARPLVSTEAIERCAGVAAESGAAMLATPVADTLKKARDEGSPQTVDNTIPRERIWAAQTPQIFGRELLLTALERCEIEGWEVTDDASMFERMGQPVTIVEGDSTNFKITTPADATLAESLIERRRAADQPQRSVMRTGIGYDVHRFAENRPLMLGGVEIPFELGLEGHSDADVLLHAITDALLGAAALGDIGTHFPPSDPEWHDARSEVFLRGAASLLADAGYAIVNVDATIVAEAPKILPYAPRMRERIAAVLGTLVESVSIKATTNEQMGFIGRKEGIAALATVLIEGTAR